MTTTPDTPAETPGGPTLADYGRAWHILCSTLLEEANYREWCSEYDDIVDNVNTQLPGGIQVPLRQQAFTIQFDCHLTPQQASDLEVKIDSLLRNEYNTHQCTSYEVESA